MTMTKMIAKLKRAWKSWTINYGLLLSVAGVVQMNIKAVVPPQYVGLGLLVIGVIIKLLRFKTNAPLEDK